MQYEVIKKSSNLVHDWAGGYTAEIFLYPRDSDYRKKNFEVRVSAAFTTVDDAKFSDFSGFKRFISPTEGTMSIKHKDHYEKELKPFEIDAFGGSWDTSSDGIYHDFNLLLGKGWDGLIMSINNNRQIDVFPKLVGFAGVFACIRTMVEIDDTKIVELDK